MSDIQYNFVVPTHPEYSLEELIGLDGGAFPGLYYRGEYIWGHQTYVMMKKLGLPVELSFTLDPDAVNLGHGNVLRALKIPANCFCVSLQADFPHFPLAQFHIVQNREQTAENAIFIPHWPQPSQQSRDPERTEVTRAAYQGARNFSELDEKQLNEDLKAHGITFEILEAERWPDLREVDILVGIRSFGKKSFKRKPPTKLVDAWHAAIPFVGGWDSAYTQVGSPNEDYLRVSSYQELVDSLVYLKEHPEKYEALVAAGRKKADGYTAEAISEIWKTLLQEDVLRAYEQWGKNPVHPLLHFLKEFRYISEAGLKRMLQKAYRVPLLKRLRDRYYDPVK